MIRFVILCTCLVAILTGCYMTRAEAEAASKTTGTIGSLFGIPAPIGEALSLSIMSALGLVVGHKNGRRTERKAQCRVSDPRDAKV